MSDKEFMVTFLIIVGIVFTGVWFFGLSPKLELCEVYYKELSTWSCLNSDYGLPARGAK